MKKIISIILVLVVLIVLSGCVKKEKEVINKKEKKMSNLIEDSDISNSIFKNSYKRAQEIVSEMSLEEKIGQLFLVRYELDNIDNNINYNPGGYILFAKDFDNHTMDEMKKEIDNDQSKYKYPLIMGVDEEGGFVTRVSRYPAYRSEKFKSPRSYYDEGGYPLLEQIESEKATLLKNIGLNLNLAPVSDVSVNPSDFIYNRAFGYDAEKTAEFVGKMVGYANKNKINSCLKHFPGYGNNIDTHTDVAVDNRSYEEISGNDYLPFKAGIEAGVPSILVSHNIVNSIDNTLPSSLSEKVVGELRDNLGFTGIVMTDDLAMDAVKKYVESGNAASLAIKAGCDMIITSDFIPMYNELLEAVKNKQISEDVINKAVLRIIAWKVESNIMK